MNDMTNKEQTEKEIEELFEIKELMLSKIKEIDKLSKFILKNNFLNKKEVFK